MRWKAFRIGWLYIRIFAGKSELELIPEYGVMLVRFGIWRFYISVGHWMFGVDWALEGR